MTTFFAYESVSGRAGIASGAHITFDDRGAYIQEHREQYPTPVRLLRTMPFPNETSAWRWLRTRCRRYAA